MAGRGLAAAALVAGCGDDDESGVAAALPRTAPEGITADAVCIPHEGTRMIGTVVVEE